MLTLRGNSPHAFSFRPLGGGGGLRIFLLVMMMTTFTDIFAGDDDDDLFDDREGTIYSLLPSNEDSCYNLDGYDSDGVVVRILRIYQVRLML